MLLYALKSKHGLEATVSEFGATLISLKTPDRDGKLADIVLGYDDVDAYEHGKAYIGGTIGRYANRIAAGKFTLNGVTYHLATNDGPNHLHGGSRGFHRVIWKVRQITTDSIEFGYTSQDKEEGYPGTLEVRVKYTLRDSNDLRIDYSAQELSDKDTVVNLTNHSYFNLTGNPHTQIVEHDLTLFASRFTPIDAGSIPTGELRPVQGTPFDFRVPKAIGARICDPDEQLKLGKGYDHNFVIDRQEGTTLVRAAEVYEPTSGRVMKVATTEPGLQFYSGNHLDGSERGKKGQCYGYRSGFCLETQHFPDSPNHPEFPATTLKAGHRYTSATVFSFSSRPQ